MTQSQPQTEQYDSSNRNEFAKGDQLAFISIFKPIGNKVRKQMCTQKLRTEGSKKKHNLYCISYRRSRSSSSVGLREGGSSKQQAQTRRGSARTSTEGSAYYYSSQQYYSFRRLQTRAFTLSFEEKQRQLLVECHKVNWKDFENLSNFMREDQRPFPSAESFQFNLPWLPTNTKP